MRGEAGETEKLVIWVDRGRSVQGRITCVRTMRREWELSVLVWLSGGKKNWKGAKLYILAGVKHKLLHKHNEEWEKSIESHFLPLVREHTYLPINSNNWLANKRLHYSCRQQRSRITRKQLPGRRRSQQEEGRMGGWGSEHAFIGRVTWREKHSWFRYENVFDSSRIKTGLSATHPH